MKLDLWMLDRLDTFTTKLQRKGILLTSVHVYVAGVTLASNVVNPVVIDHRWLVPFAGLVWGVSLFFKLKWADENKDYPSSVRMMEKLNAKALRNREDDCVMRWMWLVLWMFLVPSWILNIIEGDYIKAISSTVALNSAVLLGFIDGCFFIGPGEFAKQTKEKHVHNAITSRG